MTEGIEVKRKTAKAVIDIAVTVLLFVAMILVVFSANCVGAIFG